jgi:hypothetical protein
MQDMNIFDYVATYNMQDAERLAQLEAQQLEMFDNEQPMPLSTGVDLEKKLNQVIDVQERMAKGSKMIAALQAKIDSFQDNPVPYNVFMAHVDRIKKLKAHWWNLKRYCDSIIGPHRQVWGMYFGLVNEELNEYFTYGGDDVTDELAQVDSRHAPTDEIYADAHQDEMAEYTKPFNENPYLPRDWWDEWSFNRRENEKAELASLEQYAGF